MNQTRKLSDLVSVGPATLKDFSLLGIKSIQALRKENAPGLYRKLCKKTQIKHDPCVEDVFAAAIAQALDPELAEEKKHWSYWSAIRKNRPRRCAWVPAGNELYERYHDTEWGVPVHDDQVHFEFLILEGAQAGLSWETILKRREGYKEAFANFDWKRVARFDSTRVEELLNNERIIRNRAKIQSAVINAASFDMICHEFGSFDAYVWQFVEGKPLQGHRRTSKEIPALSPESKLLSNDLKRRGMSFVGPTVIYAHMQATGLINDHTTDCFRYADLKS